MKALILVGGFGTRLRPLTWTRPKPLVPFANRPMVLHQVAALKKVGVTEVVLAVNYQSETFTTQLAEWEKEFGIKFTLSLETTPLGTAGPLALAGSVLRAGGGDDFFVLNSDVVVAFDEHKVLERMVKFHKEHKKEGTLLVTKVKDPTKYGVVVTDAKTGQINSFVEKPKDHSFGDLINAGIYLFNKSILNRIEIKPTSIEKETFPAMVKDGQLFCQTVEGFWMDIGQPKDYLIGMDLFLNDTADNKYAASSIDTKTFASCGTDVKLAGNLIIDRTIHVGNGVTIGPNVVIGKHVVLGRNVTLKRCTLMDGVRIEAGATVTSSIIGFNSLIRDHAVVRDSTLGDATVVNPSAILDDVKLFNEHSSSAGVSTGGHGSTAAAEPFDDTMFDPKIMYANIHVSAVGGKYSGSTTKDFIPHGYGEWYDKASGARYVGGFKNGVQHGPGILFFSNGTSKIGQWVNGTVFKGFQHAAEGGAVTVQQFTPAGDSKNYNAIPKHKDSAVLQLVEPKADAKDSKAAAATAHGGAGKSSPAPSDAPVPTAGPDAVVVEKHAISVDANEFLQKVFAVIASNAKSVRP